MLDYSTFAAMPISIVRWLRFCNHYSMAIRMSGHSPDPKRFCRRRRRATECNAKRYRLIMERGFVVCLWVALAHLTIRSLCRVIWAKGLSLAIGL